MERAEMTDAELLDAIFEKLLAFLKPIPGVPGDETCLQIIELFEANGRSFLKADWPAND
jgi:hypothetical protein